jgi:NDP-sugar pyrophosphorylase family protein
MPEQTAVGLSGIILTGGLATRMRPLSLDCSKSMLPFLGRPLLAYLLRDISSSGLIRKVLLTHPGKNDDIRRYFGDGADCGVPLEYCASRRWSGTAGAVLSLLAESPQALSSPFLVVYGDSLLRMNYRALLDFHIENDASMTIACHRPRFDAFLFEDNSSDRQRTNFGIAELGPNGLVTRFEEKPCLNTITTSFINPVANAAVYVIDPRALQAVPRPENSTFDFAYHVIPWLIENGERVAGLDIDPGFRVDIGTLPHYLSLQLETLRGNVQMHDAGEIFPGSQRAIIDSSATLVPPFVLGNGAEIRGGAVLESSILGDRVVIESGAHIRESVILADAVVGARAVIDGSILGPHTQISSGAIVPRGTVISAWSRIGGPELLLVKDVVRGLIFDDSGGLK